MAFAQTESKQIALTWAYGMFMFILYVSEINIAKVA
jgi:hypothetical protein